MVLFQNINLIKKMSLNIERKFLLLPFGNGKEALNTLKFNPKIDGDSITGIIVDSFFFR